MTISISGLIDLRDSLPTMRDGQGGVNRGPYGQTMRRNGAVIHYDGDTPIDFQWVNEEPSAFYSTRAWFHINKNWGSEAEPIYGSGIMYHIGLAPDGRAFQLRDLHARLWHCGESEKNNHALALYLPLGGTQIATREMQERMNAILDEYRKQTGDTRLHVYGHGEVTPTQCPGPSAQRLVQDYRAGPELPLTTDELLERAYQKNPSLYGTKIAKLWVNRPYYMGDALRCERAILTPAGRDILNYLVDDGITLLGDQVVVYQ